jgi:hypothetical protein
MQYSRKANWTYSEVECHLRVTLVNIGEEACFLVRLELVGKGSGSHRGEKGRQSGEESKPHCDRIIWGWRRVDIRVRRFWPALTYGVCFVCSQTNFRIHRSRYCTLNCTSVNELRIII